MLEYTLQELADKIGHWQDKTFPSATQESIIAHLKKEVNTELYKDCNEYEIADCIMLLLGLARKRKISIERIVLEKFAINRQRKWGKPNTEGFVEHIKEERR